MDGPLTVAQAAEKWGYSKEYLRDLLQEGLVSDAYKESGQWLIPQDAKINRSRKPRISHKKRELALKLLRNSTPEKVATKLGISQRSIYNIIKEAARKSSAEKEARVSMLFRNSLRRQLERLHNYLSKVEASDEVRRNTLALYEKRIWEQWRLSPYVQLSIAEIQGIDPAMIERYVIEIAEKITSDLDILREAQVGKSPERDAVFETLGDDNDLALLSSEIKTRITNMLSRSRDPEEIALELGISLRSVYLTISEAASEHPEDSQKASTDETTKDNAAATHNGIDGQKIRS